MMWSAAAVGHGDMDEVHGDMPVEPGAAGVGVQHHVCWLHDRIVMSTNAGIRVRRITDSTSNGPVLTALYLAKLADEAGVPPPYVLGTGRVDLRPAPKPRRPQRRDRD
jgi:hypothetical protein